MDTTSTGRDVSAHVNETTRKFAPARYHCITPVWGAKYVERFVEVALPSLLASGNLPSLPAEKCLYQVFTRAEDVPLLLTAPSFRRLKELMSVSIELIDDIPLQHPYIAMTLCHRRALQGGEGVDAAYVFLLPDHVWSDGSFVAMQRVLESGKRAIVVAGIRVRSETAEPRFKREYLNTQEATLSIAARPLVEVMLSCFHPQSTAQLVDAGGNLTVSRYYWDVNGHGMIARCCDLLPMVVWPRVCNAPIPTTFDHEYVRLSCPLYEDIHIVTDSDEICVVEISESMHHTLHQIFYGLIDTYDVVQWMNQWTNSYHRAYLQTPIFFHAHDLEFGNADIAAEWSPVLQRSNDLVRHMIDAYHKFHADLPDQGDSLVGARLDGRPESPPPEDAAAARHEISRATAAQVQAPTGATEVPEAPGTKPNRPCIAANELSPIADPSLPDAVVFEAAKSKVNAAVGRTGLVRRIRRHLRGSAVGIYQWINRPLCRRISQLEHQLIQVEQGIPGFRVAQEQTELKAGLLEQRIIQLEEDHVRLQQWKLAQLMQMTQLEETVRQLEQASARLEQNRTELTQRVTRLEQTVPQGNGYKAWMLNSHRESLNQTFAVRRVLERTTHELRNDVESLKKQLSVISQSPDIPAQPAKVALATVPEFKGRTDTKRAA